MTGRSYHADLGCGNTARRVHYLLEPGRRADQAIQGLGPTHRTHQATAPLFRPVAPTFFPAYSSSNEASYIDGGV